MLEQVAGEYPGNRGSFGAGNKKGREARKGTALKQRSWGVKHTKGPAGTIALARFAKEDGVH